MTNTARLCTGAALALLASVGYGACTLSPAHTITTDSAVAITAKCPVATSKHFFQVLGNHSVWQSGWITLPVAKNRLMVYHPPSAILNMPGRYSVELRAFDAAKKNITGNKRTHITVRKHP